MPDEDHIIKGSPTENNKVSAQVVDTMSLHGPYNPTYQIRESWKDLPTFGPFEYPSGSTYIGQYKFGLRHGEGKFVGKDGSIYEGQWQDDKRSGIGRFISWEGDIYVGSWVLD